MKKFVKMSLVAALAVAGTTASAQPLAEAIQNVDVSGTVAYRYDDRDDKSTNLTNNSYKIAINTKSKINDDVTFNARTVIGGGNTDMAVVGAGAADSEAAFALTQANFAYTGLANTTIIAGKQAVPSPFAVQADAAGDEDTGNGLTAITTVGPVTLAATYLQNTNLVTADNAIAGVGILGSIGPVALDAWYLDVADQDSANDGHKAYTVGAKANIEMVSVYARYSAIEPDATNEKESLWKIGASAKLGIVGLSVDYGKTNDVTTYQRGVNLTGDADAAVNLQGWALNLNTNDSSLVKVSANVDVAEGLNLSVSYLDKDAGVAADSDEIYGQATYKMGKNLMTYLRIGEHQTDGTPKGTRGRLHVQYSF